MPAASSNNASKTLVSIIIPVLNEEAIVERNLSGLATQLDIVVGVDKWQILVVDNNSDDNTREIIDAISTERPGIICLHQEQRDIGHAMGLGLRTAATPYCFVMPIDEWDVPFMAWAWQNRESYDLFVGTKRADPTIYQQTMFRRVLSWGLNAMLQLFFEFTGTDTHGPKFMRMQAMRPILDSSVMNRGQYDTEFVLKAIRQSLRVVEIPVAYAELRPPRNLMLMKIVRNIRDLFRLKAEIGKYPHTGFVRIFRFPRDAVLKDTAATCAVRAEGGEAHDAKGE